MDDFLDYIKLLIFSIVAEKVGNDFFKNKNVSTWLESAQYTIHSRQHKAPNGWDIYKFLLNTTVSMEQREREKKIIPTTEFTH